MTTPLNALNHDLINFIQASATPFHAVARMVQELEVAGFKRLNEKNAWSLKTGERYYITRNDSSIIAFRYGNKPLAESGIRMLGAHTDSPCLKVKPKPDYYRHGYWQVGVETYGGVLLNPWFDRELSLAGRVSVLAEDGQLAHRLINFDDAVGMIPSLAIHLDREANSKRNINAHTDLPVLFGMFGDSNEDKPSLKKLVEARIREEHPDIGNPELLDYELSFYDVNPGRVYGVQQAFIAASRLDNLLSCYLGLKALMSAEGDESMLLICNDHEEVGSASAAGAQGPMLKDLLKRMTDTDEEYVRMIQHSMMVSVDNAHAIHPNFPSRHDENHGPEINAGPVLKINANQRYASNSETQAIFKAVCMQNNIPLQVFVVRSDMACGSTIGPITATELGIKTLDIGVPTFGMHSIRETAGTKDTGYMVQAMQAFLQLPNT